MKSLTIDLSSPPPTSDIRRFFLCVEDEGETLLSSLSQFGTNSVILDVARWFLAVKQFRFTITKVALAKIATKDDELLGCLDEGEFNEMLVPLQDALAQHCASRSSIHLFRFLQMLFSVSVSPLLRSRVKLVDVIQRFPGLRRAVATGNLLGSPRTCFPSMQRTFI
jgi:hypothetical protein